MSFPLFIGPQFELNTHQWPPAKHLSFLFDCGGTCGWCGDEEEEVKSCNILGLLLLMW